MDAQGWGREVTTHRLRRPPGRRERGLWYTDTFSGTSSASPIVVGAAGLRCRARCAAAGQPPLTPWKARQLLRATGSPQQDEPGRPRDAADRPPARTSAKLMPRATDAARSIPMARLNAEALGSRVQHGRWASGSEATATCSAYKAADWVDDQGTTQGGGPMFIAMVDANGQQCSSTHQDTWTGGWSTMLMTSVGGVAAPRLLQGGRQRRDERRDRRHRGGRRRHRRALHGRVAGRLDRARGVVSMDGGDLLLCYGSAGDQISLDVIAADATDFSHNLVNGTWEAGWTHLLVHELPGGPHLFCGQAGGGSVCKCQINRDGSLSRTFAERWQSAWALFAGFDLSGERYQISYQPSTGWAAIDRVLPDENGFETISFHDLGTGHTALTAFPTASGVRALTYSSDSGEAAYWSIGWPTGARRVIPLAVMRAAPGG